MTLPKGDQWPTLHYHYLVLHSVLASANNRRTLPEPKVKSLSCVRLFVTPWTVAYQAPLSIEFSRQEYWSGLPFPSPGDLPNPGIIPGVSHIVGRCFTIWATREAQNQMQCHNPSTLCSRKPLLPRCTRVDETYLVSCLTPFILFNQDKSQIT